MPNNKLDHYDIFIIVIGSLIVVGFLSLLWAQLFVAVPLANSKIFDMSLGALAAMTSTFINYLVGSSRGSQKKDDHLRAKSEIIADAIKGNGK